MSSIFAWNEYMKTFINELCETFPECVELFALTSAIDAMISEDEYSVLNKFVEVGKNPPVSQASLKTILTNFSVPLNSGYEKQGV